MGCPACSYRVTGSEKACPRCGKKFEKGTKFECPFCGGQISRKAERCPSCQVDLLSIQVKHESAAAGARTEAEDLEPKPLGDDGKRFVCPGCGTSLEGTEQECPKCGRAISGKLGLQCPLCGTSVDLEFRECPICGISLERALRKPGPTVQTDLANTHPCPNCRAIIPDGLENCPLCKSNFAALVAPAEPVAEEGISAPSSEAATAADAGKVPPQPKKVARQRKLKSKVTTVPVTIQTGAARGRTNGMGQINGLGKVNGTGAVNGRAFVNGTGVPGGPSRPSKTAAKHKTFLTRWQFLAILVALVVVIPTFMFFSYSKDAGKFSVDGNFDEWSDVRTLGSRIYSTSASNNITAWSVIAEGPNLFLHIETQSPMMSSPSAESFYLFIDSDGSSATGYTMESIGADYMVRLTGWNSTIASSSLSSYTEADQYNWNAWTSVGSVSSSMESTDMEARANIPVRLADSARFVLVSKDSAEAGSVSYTAPLTGGLLVVEQSPSAQVESSGVVPISQSVAVLVLRFSCQGEGGEVTQLSPDVRGATLKTQVQPFTLAKGETREITIEVDTSAKTDGQFVSAEVAASDIVSTFAGVEVFGSGAKAYAGSAASVISIDGAFADWTGHLSMDQDSTPVTDSSVDIDSVGNVSNTQNSFFYVSVEGELCSGTFVPALIGKPSGAGGGGTVAPTRRSAEDILTVYVESDMSGSTGKIVTLDGKTIGADQKIEVKGLFGKITSAVEYDWSASSSDWEQSSFVVTAAKDDKRIEIGVGALSLGGASDIDFIVETTSWKGRSDLATFDPSRMIASTRTWIVDPAVTSPYATSMSYQRKMFWDGVNFWSFYFDGTDTVHKYSVDYGQTWNYCGPVFTTTGVNETSIWYDEPTMTVYAVGDISRATRNVSVQAGVVNPSTHTITWAVQDSSANVSKLPASGKNAYISKDANGHLWILSSNFVQASPLRYQLSAYVSTGVGDVGAWTFSGNMLGVPVGADNVKGSIVPAGNGSDVWAVYAWGGNVGSRKCAGTWQAQQMVYTQAGSKANTDNSPPSVVVDGNGVIHVVYGTGRQVSSVSAPVIEWSHNFTGRTDFTAGVQLDQVMIAGVADFFPTISLDTLTGELYVLWLRSYGTTLPTAVIGKRLVSNSWTDMTIEQQTTFPKVFLTSAYSVPGASRMCWQWTENTTTPINVFFDGPVVPEFSDLAIPAVGLVVAFVAYGFRTRARRVDP